MKTLAKAKATNTAPVLAMTKEMATKLARGFKTGIKNKSQKPLNYGSLKRMLTRGILF